MSSTTGTFNPSKWQATSAVNPSLSNITLEVENSGDSSKIVLTKGNVSIESQDIQFSGLVSVNDPTQEARTKLAMTAKGVDIQDIRNNHSVAGIGYTSSDSALYPYMTFGKGVDSQGSDAGMVKKFSQGIWIGDSDCRDDAGTMPSYHSGMYGIFINFTSGTIQKCINGYFTSIGTGVFG